MANITAPYRPTTRTVGSVGDIYTDSITGHRFRCVAIHEIRSDEPTFYYTWVCIMSNSGSSSNGDGTFIDETTGIRYVLKVDNGKLTMEEV